MADLFWIAWLVGGILLALGIVEIARGFPKRGPQYTAASDTLMLKGCASVALGFFAIGFGTFLTGDGENAVGWTILGLFFLLATGGFIFDKISARRYRG